MKVLITGHTHGIGKAILDNCPSDYEVKGMSRETGHDLVSNLPDTLGQIKEYNPDIFFNNAWGKGQQNEIALWFIKNENLKEPRVMITTGSSLSSMMHVHDEPNFYPKAVKVPTPEYANAKKKLGLEAYMHWITNTAETYWTDYALGFVRTRMTCGENLSLFDELNLLDADKVAKRMWTDIENENYKNTFSVVIDCKRSGTEQERVMLFMKFISQMSNIGL